MTRARHLADRAVTGLLVAVVALIARALNHTTKEPW